ncbi:hypothetical protein B2J93_6154 [Marssonina coronariae]|uniref:Uncharacterized protein n=1 Tax=Diplocarpon coronariae TaxID=2795749 RepID=A0A218ZJ63_9HELO|nr:hypothetical protein B2J93_6154 [Marssonina coronariae]
MRPLLKRAHLSPLATNTPHQSTSLEASASHPTRRSLPPSFVGCPFATSIVALYLTLSPLKHSSSSTAQPMSSQENMSPANTDPEKAALDSAHTSASPASKTDESTLLKQEVAVPKPPMARQCPLLVLLLLAILAVTFVSASHGRAIVRGLRCGESKRHFQELLNSVDAAALHKVLHEHASESRYQHGIYQDDRTAMEALHQEDADVATSLVELARRQAGNTTVVTATETSIRVSTSTSVVDPSTTAPGTTSQSRVTDPTTTAPGSTSQSQAITRTPATSAAPTTQAPDLTTSATTPPANPTSAPTTAAAAPSKSAGQSTNGTFLGGSAAYPFAPPIPVPTLSSARHVQNSSYVPPTAIPSFASYVLFQNVSESSSSAVSSSFTYAPPVLSSILVVQNKTTALPTPHSTYLPPVNPPPFYNTTVPNLTSVYTSCSNSSSTLPPPMNSLPHSAPAQNSSVVSTSAIPNFAGPDTTAAPYSSVQDNTFILNSPVSDSCTSSSSSNSSSPQTAMSSPSGHSFNNSTSGASPTPSSPAGTATPSSDSPVSSAASATPSTSGSGIFTSSTTVVQQSTSVAVQSSTTSQASSNGATVDSSPSSTPVTQGSTSGTSTSGTSTSGTSTSGSSTSGSPTSDTPRSTHSITQQTIYTTTFANGKVATVTQVTVVPGQVDETGSSGGSKTTTAKGSLQTNGAETVKHVGLSGVLGALGLVVAGVL